MRTNINNTSETMNMMCMNVMRMQDTMMQRNMTEFCALYVT